MKKKILDLMYHLSVGNINKDRFHNQLTPEQLSELTCTKGSYEAEPKEKCETSYKTLEAKVEELKKRHCK